MMMMMMVLLVTDAFEVFGDAATSKNNPLYWRCKRRLHM